MAVLFNRDFILLTVRTPSLWIMPQMKHNPVLWKELCAERVKYYQTRVILHSDQEVECLNQLAVLGALSTGSGFSQECEKFSVMNMTYMSKHVFASCERTTETILDACVERIRNKICLICRAVETGRIPDKNHICYKNWNGSSTGMESNIIIGVQFLETVHHICCTRIVADGDSNIISLIQEKISYGGRVLKVECANHAVRRFGRALDKLQRDTKWFSGKRSIEARKVFKKYA
ncbi:uncharacterized protein TNIN_291931 [Trichonephila inaurata madagascariensis]|uniref:Mutator-like transposase domain-containing protein n=1 Tax=Trichonephila inaurata madagascariensis TaxID=2747483 RepID=A0A8X7C6Z6_9ARAC|nr:uncharacterized protein TNIN_291931 [Trichonephila inaurata madagascariensis]